MPVNSLFLGTKRNYQVICQKKKNSLVFHDTRKIKYLTTQCVFFFYSKS